MVKKPSNKSLSQSEPFELIDIIDYLRVIYLNVNTLSFICSYFIEGNYFNIILTLIIIEKSSITGFTLINDKHKNTEEKDNFFKTLLLTLFNLNHFRKLRIYEYDPKPFAKFIPFLACIIYDIIAIIYIFFNGAIYEIPNALWANIFLIQIFLGILYKAIILQFLLVDISSQAINKTNVYQFISIFFGVVSMQGIGFFLLQKLWICLCLFLWKLLLSGIESYIIIKNQLEFFGCQPQNKILLPVLNAIINISYFPVDYAPFYDNEKLIDEHLDFKFTQVATQYSIVIVKIGQLVDILLMIVLIYSFDLIPNNKFIAYTFYQLVIGSIILYMGVQVFYVMSRTLSYLSQKYTYFYTKDMSLNEITKIMQNNQQARLIEASNVHDIHLLAINSGNSERYYKQRKEIFEAFVNIKNHDLQLIKISHQLFKHKGFYRVSPYYFIDVILEYIESEEHLKPLLLQQEVQPERKENYKQAIFNRLFKFGLDENLDFLVKNQNPIDNELGKEMVNSFMKEFVKFYKFQKEIAPILHTNPQVVYYDLYDTLGLN